MVELPVLNRLTPHGHPVRVEESVVQVDDSLSNQVVPEQVVVVVGLNLQRRSSWELSVKLIHLVENRICLV